MPTGRGPQRHLATLERLKLQFDRPSAARKLSALHALRSATLNRARDLLAYHDALLFLRAHPDSRAILQESERQLLACREHVDAYLDAGGTSRSLTLLGTGLAGTSVVHPFSFALVQRLMPQHARRLDLELGDADDKQTEALGNLLTQLIVWTENDSLDYDDYFDLRDWIGRARGRRKETDLVTLVRLFEGSGIRPSLQGQLFDDLLLSVRVNLDNAPASRTLQRLPWRHLFYQKTPRRGRCRNLREELVKPPTPLRLLPETTGRKYARAIQEVLTVRNRELFPATFAHPAEVYVNEPGRGVQIVLYGMEPDLRLPFETNWAYMLVRNGVPVGYGVAANWFDRAEIAINVFPAYRAGESAFMFEQLYRLFYHHLGARAFYVRSHQLGIDDEEPLESGAFWFYYKLGFRATNPLVWARAEKEQARLSAARGRRSSRAMLKSLADTNIFLHVDPEFHGTYREPSLVDLAYAVTGYFARHGGDRVAGTRQAVKEVSRALGITGVHRWRDAELVALERLAPLVACIPDLGRWPAADKRALARIIRAKGGPCERDYVLRCCRHARFRAALQTMGDRIGRNRT